MDLLLVHAHAVYRHEPVYTHAYSRFRCLITSVHRHTCMYVCVPAHLCMCLCFVRMCFCACVCARALCICVFECTCLCVCFCVHVFASEYELACVCLRVCVRMCVFVCVCACICGNIIWCRWCSAGWRCRQQRSCSSKRTE